MTRSLIRTFVALALVLSALAAQTARVHAHASVIGSEPPDNAVIAKAPESVVVTFNEPVSLLTLQLVVPGGETRELSGFGVEGQTLRVPMPSGLGRGTHLLSWRVVSADGHPVGGSMTFSIGEPTGDRAELLRTRDTRVRERAIWLCKVLLYLGLMLGCGGALYAVVVARRPLEPAERWLVVAGLGVAGAATIFSAGLQGADAYDAMLSGLRSPDLWRQGLATSYGTTVVIALAAMTCAGVSLFASQPASRVFAVLGMLGVGAALAASGHASSGQPQWLMRPLVFVHGISVAFWIGALPFLRVALSRNGTVSELRRFSALIPWSIAALLLSGVVLSLMQARSIDALWATAYGNILVAKLVLVAGLLALGGYNRFVLTPRVIAADGAAATAMRRSCGAEIAIAVVILALVAIWRFTPPPRALQAAASAPVHAHIHAGKAMADIRIERQPDGARLIQLTLLDGEFGPLTAKEVVLLLSRPESGIERTRFPARNSEATIWRIPNVRLPVGGRWRARVEILIDDFEKVAIEGDIDLPR